MAIYTMYPVIDVTDLEDAIRIQFGVDVEGEMRNILFGDDYMNDCYKSYCFEDDEVYESEWQDEEGIRIRNLVNAYLRDILPDYTHVLIDMTW